MKTLSFIMILLCLNIIRAQSSQVVKATFGRYSENCLAGRGLCSFDIANDGNAGKTGGILSANTFVLKIKRAGLSDADQINIAGKRFRDFAKGEQMYFRQPESLRIRSEALVSLSVGQNYNTIAPGTYPLTLQSQSVDIIFTLSPPQD